MLLQLISIYIAGIFALVNYALTIVLFVIVKYSAGLPFAYFRINNISNLALISYFLILFLMILAAKNLKNTRLKFTSIVILTCILLVQLVLSQEEFIRGKDFAIFLTTLKNDDYSLLRFPDGKSVLIYNYLKSRGRHRFNYRIVQILNNIGMKRINYLALNCPLRRFNEYSFKLTRNLNVDTLLVPENIAYEQALLEKNLKIKGVKNLSNYNEKINFNNSALMPNFKKGLTMLRVEGKRVLFLHPQYFNIPLRGKLNPDVLIIAMPDVAELKNLIVGKRCKIIIVESLKGRFVGVSKKLEGKLRESKILNKAILLSIKKGKFYLVNWAQDFSKIELK